MENLTAVNISVLIPLLPLLGAIIAGFFGAKWLKGNSHLPIWGGVGIAALISILLFFETLHATPATDGTKFGTHIVYHWISAGPFQVDYSFFFDPLTVVMLLVVCGIGFLITVFAAGYMKGEEGYFRFFAYLGLFIFSMTNLVMGANLIMLFLGWEGVGLCSYLLIGYYYDKPSAREAAKKAFLVNRIGDFGFGLGIMLIFWAFGTTSYYGDATHPGFLLQAREALAMTPEAIAKLTPQQLWIHDSQIRALNWIPYLLMVGAFGKSAQFPLYVWLPDAMEGPTPVSALIHAATMVTAGVYMIARCSTVFVTNSNAMVTVALVGAFTAIFAASIALRQFDLKKVFAYSTISQLGFMFVGVGVIAPVAGIFHLVTHAFFKALLFLSSGVVMHAMMGELDMRKMSGLKKVLPKTYWLMMIGCGALSGFPLLSGFFSKDEIVGAALKRSPDIAAVLLVAAFMTAYYTFRLFFRVFEGPLIIPEAPAGGHGGHGGNDAHDSSHDHAPADSHGHGAHDHEHHDHEPNIMILPLVVLAAGAFLGGLFNFPGSEKLGHFLGESPSVKYGYELAHVYYEPMVKDGTERPVDPKESGQEEGTEAGAKKPETELSQEYVLMLASGGIAILGFGLAFYLHKVDRTKADELAEAPGFAGAVKVLDAKYKVDEFYQAGIVEPLRTLGRWCWRFDNDFIDNVLKAITLIPEAAGNLLRWTSQRGYLQGYAAAMLLGLAVILLLIFAS
jgi:NADH-quinone oxidoreductase subunit L